MTAKDTDNAGGLDDHVPVPLSEELRVEAALTVSAQRARLLRMANQAEMLEGELCRAAPAGGDAVRDALAGQTIYLMGREHISDERKPMAELVYGMTVSGTGVLFCMKDTEAAIPKDSAPAGGDWHAGYKAGYHDAKLGHDHSATAGGDEWPFVEEIRRDGKPTGYWIRKGSPTERRFRGIGELERTGCIPAGAADERDARDEQEHDDELCFPEHEVEAMKLEDAQDEVSAQRRLHEEMLEWEEMVEGGDISARELWRQVRPSLGTLRRLLRDSAPAGSGEVASIVTRIERILKDSEAGHVTGLGDTCEDALNSAIELLRKLQQGADSKPTVGIPFEVLDRVPGQPADEVWLMQDGKCLGKFKVAASQDQEGGKP